MVGGLEADAVKAEREEKLLLESTYPDYVEANEGIHKLKVAITGCHHILSDVRIFFVT